MFSDYIDSTGSTKTEHGDESPVLFTPQPKKHHYDQGFIERYFAQERRRSKKITEISKEQFLTYKKSFRGLNNKIYEVFSIEWEITGPKDDIYKGNVPITNGVRSTNQNLLDLEEEEHPGISNYLDDPLQFWEGRL